MSRIVVVKGHGIHLDVLPGIPTPRLTQAGGGEAYFVPNEDEKLSERLGFPGVWYLHVPGKYESPDGQYTQVRIERIEE